MKITVFTSNQPRHLGLIGRLALISDVTYAVMECNTVFPGEVADFYKKTNIMKAYFSNVIRAEAELFGDLSFSADNVRCMSVKAGDLNLLSANQLAEALNSDYYVVFGASYIKGWLIDYLVSRSAINIHMGLSPYYRGSSCNFWALYDNRPEYVGATVHMLSKGLDSGPILYHAVPKLGQDGPFTFTMRAVEAAQKSLVERIASGEIKEFVAQPQDKGMQIRYTRNSEFDDTVAEEFLARNIENASLSASLERSKYPALINPFYA